MEERAISEHHTRAKEFNDSYAVMRQDYRRSSFAYGRKKIEELLQQTLAEIPPGGKVLDVGCGTGEQLRFCRDLGFDVTGLEPAANMRVIAKQNHPDIPIFDGLATQLPFPDKRFDLVLAIEVLRYFERADIEEACQEMVRVTKPGGRIFFVMVNRYALDGFYIYNNLHRLANWLGGRAAPIQCDFTTPAQIRSDLRRLGLTDVQCYGRMSGFLRVPYKLNRAVGARIAEVAEPWDDCLSQKTWSVPFAGHLIVVARC
jgi:SAM-dependent methyltransferase